MEMNDLVLISIDDHALERPEAFLRHYGKHVDVNPRQGLGGLKTESMNLVGQARRPVTSGEIQAMFASA